MGLKIAIAGAGYVGLVSAACFAELGHDVVCVDLNADKISALRRGEIPIYEPGLAELVQKGAAAKRLSFETDLKSACAVADIAMIAVGTPPDESGHADLQYVFAAAETIAASIKPGAVVVTKSTVPVGTTRKILALMKKTRPGFDGAVASNPEFLREGQAIGDFMKPDRVVIGADYPEVAAKVARLYAPLPNAEIVAVGIESSEAIKYAANAFLAVKIGFINEMADFAERCGADIGDIARGIGMDRRIGRQFLNAGPGYGGSCFPKDTQALAASARDADAALSIVEAVIASNAQRKMNMAAKVKQAFGGNVRGKVIGVLGLAFKPGTDDMRDAPSIDILTALHRDGAEIQAFDPQATKEAARLMPFLRPAKDAYAALSGADAALLLTEWEEFRALDATKMLRALRGNLFIDLRNLFDPLHMKREGFHYISVGRAPEGGEAAKQAQHG